MKNNQTVNYKRFKDEVLTLYYETNMTTLDIAIHFNVDRCIILEIIGEDYLAY